MSDITSYGNRYYCIKVTKDLAKTGEIYVMADEVKTNPDGSLQFRAIRKAGDESFVTLLLPAGKWLAVYAASLLDGSAVAIEHWDEEINRHAQK